MNEPGAVVSNKETSQRVPSLDGLRAVSIALVLAHHVAGTAHSVVPLGVANRLAFGELGVRVFFVISGFLITGLLLRELDEHGRIRLSRFYLRRTMRIFPPYYAFLMILIVAQAVGWINLFDRDLLHSLTYTSNYEAVRSWNTAHTWSLAVEEQFYLLWPAVLLLAGRRRGLICAAVLIGLCPLVRLAESELWPELQSGIGQRFETMADALAAGCLLAGIRHGLRRKPFYMRLLSSRYFVLVPLIVVVTNAMHDHWRPFILVGFTIMNIGIAMTIDWCVTNHAASLAGRFLNARPVVYVGVISYSLYLWQQVFLNRSSANVANIFPWNLMLAIFLALVSFYCIERPSLTLRRRVEHWLFRIPAVHFTEPEALNEPAREALT